MSSSENYLDGIPVKISEKYKPPKKISLPGSLQNKLNAEIKIEEYDFSLERKMIDQMERLKEVRRRNAEEKQKHSEVTEIQEATQNLSLQSPQPSVSQNPILTPVPIPPRTDPKKEIAIGPINFSDFESDTSSPFDNMELKTINDLEELAHVLGTKQPEKIDKYVQPPNGLTHHSVQWNHPYLTGNWVHNSMPLQSYVIERVQTPPVAISPPTSGPHTSYHTSYNPSQSYGGTSTETVPSIMRELQSQLEERRASALPKQVLTPLPVSTSVKHVKKKNSEIRPSTLPNPLSQLSLPCKNLAMRVAEMGFSMARCARAVQLFGDDEARVIEFLLQVQKLEEDLEIPADRAERALVTNSYSEESALYYLDSLNQLMSLGFREEQVIQALARFNNDRDKALDFLIS